MENFVEFSKISEDPRFGEIVVLYNKQDPTKKLMKKVKKCLTEEDYKNS
jgi:hypothetical protein